MFGFRSPKGLGNRKISRSEAQDIEPQEIFLDSLAKKEEIKLGISEKKIEVLLSQRKIKIFGFLAFLIIFFLFGKAFYFQVFKYKDFFAKAQENKFISRYIESARGIIYDSKGEQIVFNKTSFDLYLDPKKLPKEAGEKENILKKVSDIINITVQDLEKTINVSKELFVLIKENLDHQSLVLLDTKINELPGFDIERNSSRDYKDGKIFSHVIGYTGKINADELKNSSTDYSYFDFLGREGLEKTYEKYLRRIPGKIQIERDARGNIISKNVILLPDSGGSLVLWLDANLQRKIVEELEKILEKVKGKKAAAVAINPKNGAVLALVSLPNYDNNIFTRGSDAKEIKNILQDSLHPLFNRVISGEYATGSIIKPLTASAALQENIISPEKNIFCPGKITIPHRYNPEIVYDFNDWREHGAVDMRKAIAESCNVYFYTIGGGYKGQKGLGPSNIKKYLELFGWNSKTGIDLPNENEGFIPSPEWKKENKNENWWDGDTYNLAIGQGDIKITPLEVASSFQAIANKGIIYKPQIVKKIVDNDKKDIKIFEPVVLKSNFIDEKNLQVVREGMRKGVTGEDAPHASSILLNSLPVKAAAKTGTAQTSTPEHYNNWITVFAPYDNPEIVLTILLENVPTQAAAIPPAKNILEWYFGEK